MSFEAFLLEKTPWKSREERYFNRVLKRGPNLSESVARWEKLPNTKWNISQRQFGRMLQSMLGKTILEAVKTNGGASFLNAMSANPGVGKQWWEKQIKAGKV